MSLHQKSAIRACAGLIDLPPHPTRVKPPDAVGLRCPYLPKARLPPFEFKTPVQASAKRTVSICNLRTAECAPHGQNLHPGVLPWMRDAAGVGSALLGCRRAFARRFASGAESRTRAASRSARSPDQARDGRPERTDSLRVHCGLGGNLRQDGEPAMSRAHGFATRGPPATSPR